MFDVLMDWEPSLGDALPCIARAGHADLIFETLRCCLSDEVS